MSCLPGNSSEGQIFQSQNTSLLSCRLVTQVNGELSCRLLVHLMQVDLAGFRGGLRELPGNEAGAAGRMAFLILLIAEEIHVKTILIFLSATPLLLRAKELTEQRGKHHIKSTMRPQQELAGLALTQCRKEGRDQFFRPQS